jgi:hypothetical protein
MLMTKRYEQLNMFGYNYYGGYNQAFMKAMQVRPGKN